MARSKPRDFEDDDDRPSKKSSSPTWLLVLLGVGGLMLVGGVAVCAGLLWFGKKTAEKVNDGLQEVQEKNERERQKRHEEREQDLLFVNQNKADLTMAQFKVQRPKTATTIRAQVKLGDYWNYEYRSTKETHYSFRLEGTGSSGEYGWIAKDSADGKRMYELTKDAKEHWLTLSLQWVGPDGKPTPPGQQGISILKLVEDK